MTRQAGALDEIEVTSEMIEVGKVVYNQWWPEKFRRGQDRKADLVSRVFRAMYAEGNRLEQAELPQERAEL